jgi:hypothetical protein
MKLHHSLPQNEAFYGQYAALATALRPLGYIAQALAALAEFAIIFALVRAKIADVFPAFAFAAGIIGGLVGVLLIEGGLRLFLPYGARAILYRRWAGLDLVISAFVFVVLAALGISHVYLSFKGSKDLAAVVIKAPPAKDTAPIDSTAAQATAQAESRWAADSAGIAARFAPLLAASAQKFDAAASAQRQALKRWESRERSEGQRYPTQKADIRAALAELDAARAAELADTERQKAAALESAQSARNEAQAAALAERKAERQKVADENEAAQAEAAAQVATYGGGLGWLTSVVCLLVLVAAIGIQEITNRGAGIEQTAVPGTYDFQPGVWAEFLAMLSEKWGTYARRWISAQAERTPPPPAPLEPHPLYDLENFKPARIKPERKRRQQATPEPEQNCTTGNTYDRLFETFRANGNGHHPTGPQNSVAGFTSSTTTTAPPAPPYAAAQAGALEDQRRPIGFTVGSGNAMRYNASRYRLADCLQCGATFEQRTTWQKYCCEECRITYHAAQHDGQPFDPGKKRKGRKSKNGKP